MATQTPSGTRHGVLWRANSGKTIGTRGRGSQSEEESTVSVAAEVRGDDQEFTIGDVFTVDITAANDSDTEAAPFRVGYHVPFSCFSPAPDPGIAPIDLEHIVDHTDDGGTYDSGSWKWKTLPGNTTVTPSLTFRSVPNPALGIDTEEPRNYDLQFTAIAPARCDNDRAEVVITMGDTIGTTGTDHGTLTQTTTSPAPTADVPSTDELQQGHQTEVRTRSLLQGTSSPLTEGRTYYVIREIPGWADHRRAVVTTDYEYVSLWETLDALWVENYITYQQTETVIQHHEKKKTRSEEDRETYNNRYTWSRISEILINGAQVITLVKTLGKGDALTQVWDMATDLITWGQDIANDPYKEAFTSMAHSLEAAAWAEKIPESSRDFDKDWEFFLDKTVGYYDYVSTWKSSFEAWDHFWDTFNPSELADFWRQNIEPSDLKETGKAAGGFLLNLGMLLLDHFIEDYFRAEARHAAIMSALHTVRLNLLNKIINILKDIRSQAVSPGQVIRYHVYRFVLYQMTAILNEYAGGLLGSLGGPMVWIKSASPTSKSPHKRAADHRSWADTNKGWAETTFAEVGAARSDISTRLDQSLNKVLHDGGDRQ